MVREAYLASCTMCTIASRAMRSWEVSAAECHSPASTEEECDLFRRTVYSETSLYIPQRSLYFTCSGKTFIYIDTLLTYTDGLETCGCFVGFGRLARLLLVSIRGSICYDSYVTWYLHTLQTTEATYHCAQVEIRRSCLAL